MDLPNQKIGRNELCPCGSGKKYKKCCLPLSEPQVRSSPIAISPSKVKGQFARFFRPNRWAASEPRHFEDLDRLIRLQVPLPPAESDGLWNPIRFTDFLNAARVVV